MLIIDAELQAAQKGIMALKPAFSAYVWLRRFGHYFPDWVEHLTLTDTLYAHDCEFAGDGGLVRVRHNSVIPQYEYCKIAAADLGAAASLINWSRLGTVAQAPSGCTPSVCVDPQDKSKVYVAGIGTAPSSRLKIFRSTDYGVSWSYASLLLGVGSVTHVAVIVDPANSDRVLLFYAYDPGGAGSDDSLYLVVYTPSTGTWGTPAAWGFADFRNTFTGLAVRWEGDYHLFWTCRREASPYLYAVQACAYGDGDEYAVGTWAGLVDIEVSDDTSYEFHEVDFLGAGVSLLTWLERWTGTGAFRRAVVCQSVTTSTVLSGFFTEPAPWEYEPAGDICGRVAWAGGANDYVYYVTSTKVWRGKVSQYVEVPVSRVKAYRAEVKAFGRGGFELTLDNADGAFAAAGVSGTYALLRPGNTISFDRGLCVGGTDYTGGAFDFVITGLRWADRGRGEGDLIVEAEDWRGVLGRWSPSRSFSYAAGAKTAAYIGSDICAKVGLSLAADGVAGDTGQMGALLPAFVAMPGQRGDAMLEKLVQSAGDVMRFSGSDTILYRAIADSDAAGYSAGGSGEHPILWCEFVDGSPASNVVEVFGDASAFGYKVGWAQVRQVGPRRRVVVDPAVATASDAASEAAELFQRYKGAAGVGLICCRPAFDVELYDVWAVTYTRGWTGTRNYRIMEIDERFDARRGVYEQRLGVVRIS